jgi:hypothetical protein
VKLLRILRDESNGGTIWIYNPCGPPPVPGDKDSGRATSENGDDEEAVKAEATAAS